MHGCLVTQASITLMHYPENDAAERRIIPRAKASWLNIE
jgi:hypothetical protein